MSPLKRKPSFPVIQRGHQQAYGLLAAWPHFEGGGDKKLIDIAGVYSGTPGDTAPTWSVANPYGKYLSYDGNSDWWDLGDVLDQGTNSFSVVLFLLVNAGASNARAVDKRGTGSFGTAAGYWIRFSVSGGNVSCLHSLDDGSSHSSPSTALGVNDDTWFSFVYTVDRVNDRMKVYANGEEKNDASISGVTGSVDNTHSLSIGATDSSGGTQWFDGYIADVRMYDYALDPGIIEEIARDPFALYRQRPKTLLIPSASSPPLGTVSDSVVIGALADVSSPLRFDFTIGSDFQIRVEIDGDSTQDFRNVQSFTGAIGILANTDSLVRAEMIIQRSGQVDILVDLRSPSVMEKIKSGGVDALFELVSEVTENESSDFDSTALSDGAIIARVPRIDYVARVPAPLQERTR